MSNPKSCVASATISPENVEKFLKALFGEPTKLPRHPKTISHPILVKVKSGDGIGFDTGDCVAVTNSKNNVTMLLKDNFREPFEQHESLSIAKRGVGNVKDLIPGRTYIVYDDDTCVFVKYLGHSMVMVKSHCWCDIMKLDSDRIPLHYELSLPAK